MNLLFPTHAACEICGKFAAVCCALFGKKGYQRPRCKGCCDHTHVQVAK